MNIGKNNPWLIIGDFNDALFPFGKWGGKPLNKSRLTTYRICIDYCGTVDLGFNRLKYTWVNNKNLSKFIRIWLDRA